MLPALPTSFAGLPPQSSRPAAEPPTAPAPAPLSAPVAVAKVEWAGAVRPPDAMLRAFRPDLLPKADADMPIGPPPAFAANMLDLLPESMTPPEDAETAPDASATGDVAPPEAADTSVTDAGPDLQARTDT